MAGSLEGVPIWWHIGNALLSPPLELDWYDYENFKRLWIFSGRPFCVWGLSSDLTLGSDTRRTNIMKLHCSCTVYWGRSDCKGGIFQVEAALAPSVIWIESIPCRTENIFFSVFWSLNYFRLITLVMPPPLSQLRTLSEFIWQKFFFSQSSAVSLILLRQISFYVVGQNPLGIQIWCLPGLCLAL